MPRRPFNPSAAKGSRFTPAPGSPGNLPGAPGAGASGQPGALTVSQLSVMIREAVAAGFPAKVRVVGEVSNLAARQHWFFSLKDDGGCIRCVCFASAVRKIDFPVEDGIQVVATGRVDYYDAQGQLQFYVDALEPVGQGPLEIRFRALCDELRKKGYFDQERKKRLPAVPRRVAVVTSRSGAALQDVINTAARRWAGCRLALFDVRVQGAAAAPEIAAAIAALSEHGAAMGVDAIILTRGGGSIEDLWAFNERIVADAVYRCTLPIVAAIGHETDTTVAELVADVRCATPTQAAMTLVPDRKALDHQVGQLAHRMTMVLRRQAELSRQRLEGLARHPIFRRPERMIEPMQQRLARLGERLHAELPRRVNTADGRLAALARQLRAVGPMQVLERGYSYTLGPDGKVLRSAAAVLPGDRITSVLADGKVSSEVVGEGAAAGAVPGKPKPMSLQQRLAVALPPTKTRKKARRDSGPGLFAGPPSLEGD